jgi:predicted ATPase
MRLKFSNVGIIKEADILVDGLTVLAGVNDTGKSTIGKLLYSLIKVSNNYKKVLQSNQKTLLLDMIKEISGKAKAMTESGFRMFLKDERYLDFVPDEMELKEEMKKTNQENHVSEFRKFIEYIDSVSLKSKKNIIKSMDGESSLKWSSVVSIIKEYLVEINLNDKDNMDNYIKNTEQILRISETSFEVQKAAINLMIKEEFVGQINHAGGNMPAKISLSEKGNTFIEIELLDDEADTIKNLKSTFINDITYIESPLQLRENGWKDRNGNGKGRVYLKNHVDDLMDKLLESDEIEENIISEIERNKKVKTFEKMIFEIIGGEFSYKAGKSNFVYSKDGNEFRLNNTATGIRAFAMIKLLLNSGNLKGKSILIIDEPEVHLHPQWQMDYAELIVRMVKELGIKILVNSHSPYMIEAFKVFSDHYGISDTSNFYIIKKEGDFTEAKLANEDIGKIFKELSEPFSKLDKIKVKDFVK